MKNSLLSASLALAMLWGSALRGTAQTTTQYVTIRTDGGTTNQYVQTNQVVTLVGSEAGGDYVTFPDGNIGTISLNNTITGITNVYVTISGAWATFQITTPASATVVSNYVPADAIVIPASATGNVQIILESSPDLVNWTAASPGTYGPSAATNRFFRVRAVAN